MYVYKIYNFKNAVMCILCSSLQLHLGNVVTANDEHSRRIKLSSEHLATYRTLQGDHENGAKMTQCTI